MVAAYLDICKLLSLNPRYVGARMIFGLSDCSVRDFLLQLNELYVEANGDMERLARRKLSTKEQDAALHRASDQKISSLPEWVRLPHEKVVKYVDTFGYLTRELQIGDEGVSHLLSSERGIFILPERKQGDGLDEHYDVIEECVITGYFSAAETSSGGPAFRVHNVLAPHYGFSYRGAYTAVKIKAEHLKLIANSGSSNDQRRVAHEIAASIGSHDDINQLKLF